MADSVSSGSAAMTRIQNDLVEFVAYLGHAAGTGITQRPTCHRFLVGGLIPVQDFHDEARRLGDWLGSRGR